MIDSDFSSCGYYISIPTKRNPKVILSISNRNQVSLSFNLYNPFSIKAKIYKFFLFNFCFHFNFLARQIFAFKQNKNSEFIQFLEKFLNKKPIVSSIYFSTTKEKIVIQIQSNNKIEGYIKFPLNSTGKKNILNEKKALEILSKKFVTKPYNLFSRFNKTPFLLLNPISGIIKMNKKINIKDFLNSFKKTSKFLLINHPRIIQIKFYLETFKLKKYKNILDNVLKESKVFYHEVYEHGDFAPWNLIVNNEKITAFDFEYFEEKGLEFLDEIKYYFQVEYLINNNKNSSLIKTLSSKLNHVEFNNLMIVFLLKEIIIKKQNLENFDMYDSLIKIIAND